MAEILDPQGRMMALLMVKYGTIASPEDLQTGTCAVRISDDHGTLMNRGIPLVVERP
jgi:hypothetical protein